MLSLFQLFTSSQIACPSKLFRFSLICCTYYQQITLFLQLSRHAVSIRHYHSFISHKNLLFYKLFSFATATHRIQFLTDRHLRFIKLHLHRRQFKEWHIFTLRFMIGSFFMQRLLMNRQLYVLFVINVTFYCWQRWLFNRQSISTYFF